MLTDPLAAVDPLATVIAGAPDATIVAAPPGSGRILIRFTVGPPLIAAPLAWGTVWEYDEVRRAWVLVEAAPFAYARTSFAMALYREMSWLIGLIGG
jgi:hypothetical protein